MTRTAGAGRPRPPAHSRPEQGRPSPEMDLSATRRGSIPSSERRVCSWRTDLDVTVTGARAERFAGEADLEYANRCRRYLNASSAVRPTTGLYVQVRGSFVGLYHGVISGTGQSHPVSGLSLGQGDEARGCVDMGGVGAGMCRTQENTPTQHDCGRPPIRHLDSSSPLVTGAVAHNNVGGASPPAARRADGSHERLGGAIEDPVGELHEGVRGRRCSTTRPGASAWFARRPSRLRDRSVAVEHGATGRASPAGSRRRVSSKRRAAPGSGRDGRSVQVDEIAPSVLAVPR
jgi:hypothetical protein